MVSLFSLPVSTLFAYYILLPYTWVLLARSIGIDDLTDLMLYHKTPEKQRHPFFRQEEREATLEFIRSAFSPYSLSIN